MNTIGRFDRRCSRYIFHAFLAFLMTKGLYHKFFAAMRAQGRSFDITSFAASTYRSIPRPLDRNLYWAGTEEGHEFWSFLNSSWVDKYAKTQLPLKKFIIENTI